MVIDKRLYILDEAKVTIIRLKDVFGATSRMMTEIGGGASL